MKGIVIAGFGGVGKTELAKKYKNVIDLESIFWKWKYDVDITNNIEYYKKYKNRAYNVNFPQNYIDVIKENIEKYDIVLVSYSQIIIDALKNNKIDFFICYPTEDSKDIYIERYRKRGNNEEFIKGIKENWDEDIYIAQKRELPSIILNKEETLEDYLLKNEYHLERYNEKKKR